MEGCTALGCYLQRQGGLVSFPLVTIAGLVDGINPCAIGMMVTLLGYLIVFGQDKFQKTNPKSQINSKSEILNSKILRIGIAYILSVFVTYLVIGLIFYQFAFALQNSVWAGILNGILGGGLVLAALIQIKDVFRPDLPIHLRIPTASKARLNGLVEKASLPAAILLGILVTLLETPCSLPLYVGTATVLATSGMNMALVIGYFFYYNFLFVLPLIIVLGVMYKGREVVMMREWEHKAKKWMHLGLGVALLLLGIWLLTRI